MAKLTIILDKRTSNTQGMFPIKIQICNADSSTSVSTKMFVSEKSFVGTLEKVVDKSFPNASAINAHVKQMYLEYMNAITELDYAGKLQRATAASIKEYVKRKGNQEEIDETTFSSEMDKYISTCRAVKTRQGYEYARDMLGKYMKKSTIYFDELSYLHWSHLIDGWNNGGCLSIPAGLYFGISVRCSMQQSKPTGYLRMFTHSVSSPLKKPIKKKSFYHWQICMRCFHLN